MLKLANGEVYSTQHYVTKFVSAQNFHLEKINVKDQSVLLQYSCCTIQYSSEDDSNTPVCTVGYGVERHFQQYFSHIVEVNLIGGGNHRSVASH
jgi:hypothetical protein